MHHVVYLPRAGFTLVELSIVLVIIGLLIGGILVGQSLIENAKVYGIIKDIGAIEYDVHRFKERYKQFPGDFTGGISVLGTGNAGDGNGYIDTDTERFMAFTHMNKGLGTKYPSCTATFNSYTRYCGYPNVNGNPSYFIVGVNMVKSTSWKELGYVLDYNYIGGQNAVTIRMGGTNQGLTPGSAVYPIMSATQALSLDTKIDDGQARTGRFGSPNSGYAAVAFDGSPSSICYASNNYNTARTIDVCGFAPVWFVLTSHAQMP